MIFSLSLFLSLSFLAPPTNRPRKTTVEYIFKAHDISKTKENSSIV